MEDIYRKFFFEIMDTVIIFMVAQFSVDFVDKMASFTKRFTF